MKDNETLKKLKRNFKLHMLINLAIVIIIVVAFVTDGVASAAVPIVMLGVSLVATGVTCGRIADILGQ